MSEKSKKEKIQKNAICELSTVLKCPNRTSISIVNAFKLYEKCQAFFSLIEII